jgi:hypothetical protein
MFGLFLQRERTTMDADTVYENIRALSAHFATERRERQQRHELVAADFARLREASFPLTGAPVDHGGRFAEDSALPAACSKDGSQRTLRWREPDSNPRCPRSRERRSGAKSGLQEDNRRRSLPRPRCCPVGSDCSPLRCSARAPRCALPALTVESPELTEIGGGISACCPNPCYTSG